jgi:hypothetical protein
MGRREEIPLLGKPRQDDHLLGHRGSKRHDIRPTRPPRPSPVDNLPATEPSTHERLGRRIHSRMGHEGQATRESAVERERLVRILQEAVLLERQGYVGEQDRRQTTTSLSTMWRCWLRRVY